MVPESLTTMAVVVVVRYDSEVVNVPAFENTDSPLLIWWFSLTRLCMIEAGLRTALCH